MADTGRLGSSPRWEPPAFVSSRPTPPVPETSPDARTVLVVDDQPAVRTSIARVLRSEGYKVTEVDDGNDALPLLRSEHFDAMVLDLRMRQMGGPWLLGALPDPPPTVVLSATQMTGMDRERVGEAVVAELTKPVAPQRLLDAVAAAVSGGRPPQ
jgi:two-component system response regulator MprA